MYRILFVQFTQSSSFWEKKILKKEKFFATPSETVLGVFRRAAAQGGGVAASLPAWKKWYAEWWKKGKQSDKQKGENKVNKVINILVKKKVNKVIKRGVKKRINKRENKTTGSLASLGLAR